MSGPHYVEVVDGRYVVYTIGRGMAHLSVGPGWGTPKEAARYADLMDSVERTSPLRSPGDGPRAVEPVAPGSPPPPQRGAVSELPKGSSRRRRAP